MRGGRGGGGTDCLSDKEWRRKELNERERGGGKREKQGTIKACILLVPPNSMGLAELQ